MLNVEVAYALAKHAHRAQTRKELDDEGRPLRYFEHLRGTALIAIEELDLVEPEIIISALMHDALEDTRDISAPMLEHLFGAEVAKIVLLLTKDPKEGYYERLLHWGTEKVWLVKGCDRLQNLRHLKDTTPAFQAKQLAETRKVIYPMTLKMVLQARGSKYESAATALQDKIYQTVESFEVAT